LFFVNKQKGLTEYYLVEKVLVNYFSRLKLKAEDEAKAVAAELKAKQEAKAATELKAKQEAEAKAAELKAKQDAEVAAAKAATELKAKQEAEAKAASMKKTTITCVKGKLTKKVTAVKPKCPTGYKLKK
jgi:membrane protein involved in colicin uptake